MVIIGSILNEDAPAAPPPFSYLGMLFIYGTKPGLFRALATRTLILEARVVDVFPQYEY